MPIIFIIKLYPNRNNLLVKDATHHKAEFLRASQTTLSTATLYSIQSVLNSMQNSKCSFIITTYLYITLPLQSPPKIRSFTSVNFYLPIPPLLVHKIILTTPNTTPFLYTSAIFHLPIFAYNHTQKCFPYLSHSATSGCVKGPGS